MEADDEFGVLCWLASYLKSHCQVRQPLLLFPCCIARSSNKKNELWSFRWAPALCCPKVCCMADGLIRMTRLAFCRPTRYTTTPTAALLRYLVGREDMRTFIGFYSTVGQLFGILSRNSCGNGTHYPREGGGSHACLLVRMCGCDAQRTNDE
jgi:hypothetical protein